MAWIESNQELARHPKAKRAARVLGVSVPAVVGHLHFLWWWCLEYAQDGDLSQFDASDIADAAGWEGDAEPFVRALLDCGPGESIGFLEQTETGGIAVHDWMDYAGRLIEKRQANTKRMRSARAKHVQRTCDERATHVQGLPYPTVPNSTVPINNNNAREEEKTSRGTVGTESINWAEKNWGRMIPKGEADSIIAWCDEFAGKGSQEPDAVVIEALKRCLEANARNMQYLKAVLTDWREAGVLSVSQVEARELERKSQKEYKRNKDPGDKPTSPPKTGKYEDFYL